MFSKNITLYYNTVREMPQNVIYPHSMVIHSLEELRIVMTYDHVCASYQNGHRKNENFLQSNCSMFDLDNAETDDPSRWITPTDVQKIFPNVPFYVSYSRNHMKQKGDKAPRPKFHIYFPDATIYQFEEYARHKADVCAYFPTFDDNAKDAARFFFGVENPQVEFYDGEICLFDFMKKIKAENGCQPRDVEIIPEGKRNSTMHSYALRVLKRWGDTSGKAYQYFLQKSKGCLPLLEDQELDGIWKSALKFYQQTIKKSPDYISPDSHFIGSTVKKWILPPVDISAVNQLLVHEPKNRKFSIETAHLFLQAYGITVRLNEMSRRIEINGLPPKFSGEDAHTLLVTLIADLANAMSYKRATSPIIFEVLHVIAHENRYHPVLQLLNKEPWDGVNRLPMIYDMLGLSNDFFKVLVKKWALQTIAVLYNSEICPVTAQGVLVLQGDQGIGKTEFFRHLAIKGQFFKGGTTLDMSNKDSLMSATKVWICELGEIDSTTKKEQSALKAFLTEQTDRYREPYARCETIRPRRTSFCGTVNPAWYLRDTTGNRRFWTIPIERMNIEKIFQYPPEWYTQFWRQIHEEYKCNPKGYLLTREEQDKVNDNNRSFESEVYGEDEFMTLFNTEADRSLWERKTASQIADALNTAYRGLNISSERVGRCLIPKIGKRIGKAFEYKVIHGRRYYWCPPLGVRNISQTEKDTPDLKCYVPLPDSLKRGAGKQLIDEDKSDEDIIF